MAEIPVEKKSSMAWLWWLLLLAGIIALVWWLVASNDDDADVDLDDGTVVDGDADYADPDAMNDTGMDASGDVAAITGVAGLASLADMIGRDVELSGVAVNEVVGDEAFTVGEGDNETLIMFDEERTPNTPMEGNVDVNPGSNVTITGEVREFPGDLPQSVTEEVDTTATAMIFASSVETVD